MELQRECDEVLVAIDQPIVVPNEYGGRPVDHVADGFMDTLRSRTQLAYRNKTFFTDQAHIWKFISKIGSCEYSGITGNDWDGIVEFETGKAPAASLRVIEVYPALALASLIPNVMVRGSAARYNPERKNFKLKDWRRVCQVVVKCANDLGLQGLSRWGAEMRLRWNRPDKPQKSDQDNIDAAICLLVAVQWRRQTDGVCVIGDLQTGYIVTPTSVATREILQAACENLGVCFNAAEKYDRLSGFEGSHVPTFGELLLEIPQDDQEFERLPMPNRPLDL